ncbi:MAG: N-acetylmuramoyl-L-alanine amidase [Lentisphaerae bacterium]|nr:N-acetylmuramoyl-L-alanine amidase [Lentisphaerota bacterium]
MPVDSRKRLFIAILLVLFINLGIFPLPEAYAAKDRSGFDYRIVSGRKYYRAFDIARYYRMRLRKVGSYYEMYGANTRMVFTPDKRYGSFNYISLNYDFVPVEQNGELYISSADFFNHVQVLLNVRSLNPVGVKTILIDPGHGGNDRGAAGMSYTEKALTLQVAKRLHRILSKMGYRVLMTRVNDRKIELSDRARASNSIKADLFISIHMNAATNRAVHGIETFSLTAPGSPSSGSKAVQYNKYPGNNAVNNSMFLAWNVQNILVRSTRAVDRGVKHARFVVLRETRCPSILVECGFISNRNEERNLGLAMYQEKLAQSIALGIYQYHRSLRQSR